MTEPEVTMLLSPSLVFSALLAGIYASLFHLIWGRTLIGLAWYGLAGLLGFGLGQWLASLVGLQWLMIGEVNVLGGTLGCWACLFAARRLQK